MEEFNSGYLTRVAAAGGGSRLVVIIDDNAADARLIQEAITEMYPAAVVEAWKESAAAIQRIRSQMEGKASRPDLILLDWHMPGMDGSDFLRVLKSDPVLRSIPIVIFSGSASPADVASACSDSANCFVQKPVVLDDFLTAVARIAEFWLRVVELPGARATTVRAVGGR
jgi:CheY-like chemotaxis protein